MSNLIIYANRCLTCKWRKELRIITNWAARNDMDVTTKRTDLDLESRAEAQELSIEQPFVYSPTTNKTIRLIGISDAEMDWLL